MNCPKCGYSDEDEDVNLPKSDLEDYSIKRDYYQPVDALDVKKTSQTWEAFVKCDSNYGIKMRFYRWKKDKNGVDWKVSGANFDVDGWNIDRIKRFLEKK